MTIEKLQEKKEELKKRSKSTLNNMQDIIDESSRVATIAKHSRRVIKKIEDEFEAQTQLKKIDISFLFFATALQCARQYLLTDFKPRMDDQTAAKNTKGHVKERSNREHTWYNPSLEEITTNPVPFDAMYGSPNFNLGLHGTNHRQKTLGHDPVLGWIIGTSNIATSTITVWDLKGGIPPLASYHVKTGIAGNGPRDKITNRAQTHLIFSHVKSKLIDEGLKGKILVGTSLAKEAIHLKSDVKTFKSLPFPIIYGISNDAAKEMTSYGVDTANILTIGKQATYAIVINSFIGMIHYLFYKQSRDKSLNLYSVRTNKLITYSNIIASTSNILYVMFSSMLGNSKAIQKLDIGGLLVMMHRLISDQILINQLKEEFLLKNFNKLIQGE